MISRLMILSNRFDQDLSYKSIYNSLESICKDKQEIQDKLDKHRRKAQKIALKCLNALWLMKRSNVVVLSGNKEGSAV